MSNNIKETIQALSMKTVKNGATASEEASAIQMIARLREKYNLTKQAFKKVPAAVVQDSSKILSNYYEYLNNDSIHLHVTEIDWDIVAKELLDEETYYEYLYFTHPIWEAMRKYKLGIAEKREEQIHFSLYRTICYREFSKLKRR